MQLMSSKLSEVRRKKAQTRFQSLSKLAAVYGGVAACLTLDNYIARNRGDWCSRYGDWISHLPSDLYDVKENSTAKCIRAAL